MKTLLTALVFTISAASVSAHTLTFGTGSDNNGTLTGQNTSFAIKQQDGITCLIKNTEAFGTTRYILKKYITDDSGNEYLDDSVAIDVHAKWNWTTDILVFNDKNTGDYKYRVALFETGGKKLCESNMTVTIKQEGSVYIDPDKAAAYGDIWAAMTFSVAKAEVSVIGSAGKKGNKAGSPVTISLGDGKEIQVAVHSVGTYTFPEGKVTFNYTLSTNTSGKPDLSYETTATGKTSVVHNVKLGEGEWKLSVKDAAGAEITNRTFTISK